jgi:hypothetical protein
MVMAKEATGGRNVNYTLIVDSWQPGRDTVKLKVNAQTYKKAILINPFPSASTRDFLVGPGIATLRCRMSRHNMRSDANHVRALWFDRGPLLLGLMLQRRPDEGGE